MNKGNKLLRRILLGILLLLLLLPFLQVKLNYYSETPLSGAIINTEKPVFQLKEWFEGSFQEKCETYLNQNFGLRTGFVRLNNQLSYTLFDKAKANGVIVGKEGYLYEIAYIDALNGTNFIGDDLTKEKIRKVKMVSDTLTKLNKSLIFVFAPGKARFYPEFIPDELYKPSEKTNYSEITRLTKDENLNIIDFTDYFIKSKDTSKYLLIPKLGTHWSIYGACLAQDSVLHYIEKLRKVDLPEFDWTIDWPKRAYGTDYDIAGGMNLLYRIRGPELAYPSCLYEQDSSKIQLRVISISDSFYWMFYSNHIGDLFKQHQFWYYFNDVWPKPLNCPSEDKMVKDLNLKDQIDNNDVFIILGSEASMGGLGFGFIEEAYKLYFPDPK